MRDAQNIRTLDILGIAQWMGFIFYPKSSRYVEAVPDYMPHHSKRVGVFVNSDIADIKQHVTDYQLIFVQLHGDETPDFCKMLRKELGREIGIIKTIPVSSAADFSTTHDYARYVDYFLFETPCAGYGGSGTQFDWSLLNKYHGKQPFLLTGGIGPDDAEAISRIRHPRFFGIDLNSRFETAPALKNTDLLLKFTTKL